MDELLGYVIVFFVVLGLIAGAINLLFVHILIPLFFFLVQVVKILAIVGAGILGVVVAIGLIALVALALSGAFAAIPMAFMNIFRTIRASRHAVAR